MSLESLVSLLSLAQVFLRSVSRKAVKKISLSVSWGVAPLKRHSLQSTSDKGEMNMFGHLKKRPKIPFQPYKEVTIPPKAVCGFGSPYGSISANPYDTLNDPAKPQVDPIQVGPTG